MSSPTEEQKPDTKTDNVDNLGTPTYTDAQIAKAWETCAKGLNEYDTKRVATWKEEIDTLLVFAGLFASVLTAFNIESYQLLQSNPSADATVLLLAQISTQLSSFSVSAGFVNSTQPPLPPTAVAGLEAPLISASSIRINSLWFSSLICSLSAASMGILVKQWLHQYLSDMSVSRRGARTMQSRREGLAEWRVAIIVMVLPMLLQAALWLFLANLLELLWTLHRTVAIVATVFVTILAALQLTSTILPAFVSKCPYRSPHALAFYPFVEQFYPFVEQFYAFVFHFTSLDLPNIIRHIFALVAPVSFPINRMGMVIRQLIPRTIDYNWRFRDNATIAESVARNMLDVSMLAAADRAFEEDEFIKNVIRPCIQSMPDVHYAERIFFDVVKQCSHGSSDGSFTDVVDRSADALADIALDIATDEGLSRLSVEQSSQFLSVLNYALGNTTRSQHLHHVAVAFLNNADVKIRDLAFNIIHPIRNHVVVSDRGMYTPCS
ncbi:hypothetical protein BKA93DRAFT_441342 [Sparassis latifolia]